jgi:hypothetical protein
VHVDEAQAAKLATEANAKKRKRGNKEEADIEAELREEKVDLTRFYWRDLNQILCKL